ncbi:MAG: glycosyltransferase [Rhodobacteraceae bacterium]|nr:glycosyltransferase [Paracoccaceae bacterium]
MTKPLVSIGLPVWNGEKYLACAITSILEQSFEDFELLIADNASTDRTAEIAKEFCAKDPRVRYVRHASNIGAAGNFNYVFHETTGRYFKWAAYDDMLAPDFLAETTAALEKDRAGRAALAYPQTLLIDQEGAPLGLYDAAMRRGGQAPATRLDELIGPGDHTSSLIHMCFPVFGLIRRSALETSSLISNWPRSDHLLLVELALKGDFLEIERPLFLRRSHDEGSVISAEKTASSGTEVERKLAAWFDPKRGKRFPATNIRLGLGYLRAALVTPMPVPQRARATAVALGWMRRHWRILGGELKLVLADRIRPS